MYATYATMSDADLAAWQAPLASLSRLSPTLDSACPSRHSYRSTSQSNIIISLCGAVTRSSFPLLLLQCDSWTILSRVDFMR